MPLINGCAAEGFHYDLFCLSYFFLTQKLPYLFKVSFGRSIVALTRTSRPYGIFVQLYFFIEGLTETHTAYPAVANRQRNVPVLRRSSEPYPFVFHKHTAVLS